jgi:hypothetical protein
LPVVSQNTNIEGGFHPPAPPALFVSNSDSKAQTQRQEAPTCEGLNLSSPREVHANKSLPNGQREISTSKERGVFAKLQRKPHT